MTRVLLGDLWAALPAERTDLEVDRIAEAARKQSEKQDRAAAKAMNKTNAQSDSEPFGS